jgi:uncharacterized Ntn-hydrolase superfamily protein
MTFTLVARCERTGMLGIAISSHAYAVSARCPFIRPSVGAVSTQALTDPRLGPRALDLLAAGHVQDALQRLVEEDVSRDHHQIGLVDARGGAGAYTGSGNSEWAGHIIGEGFVSMGNFLVGADTVESMAISFHRDSELDLDERLLRAIEAGRDAGGQHGGQRSAGLHVFGREPFPWVDLRVDAHHDPIGELRRIYELFRPLREYFARRPSDPNVPRPPDA